MAEYIEREKVKEVIKNYGKNAIDDGMKTLDPVDDILLIVGAVDMIPSANVVEKTVTPKTKHDLIRNMSIDELTDVFYFGIDKICFENCQQNTGNKFECPIKNDVEPENCKECIRHWLESEVVDGKDGSK